MLRVPSMPVTSSELASCDILSKARVRYYRRPYELEDALKSSEFSATGVDAVIATRYDEDLRVPYANAWKVYTSFTPGDLIKHVRVLNINKFQGFALCAFTHGPTVSDGFIYPRVSDEYLTIPQARVGMFYKLLVEGHKVVDNNTRSAYLTILRRAYPMLMVSDQNKVVRKRQPGKKSFLDTYLGEL